MKNANSRFVRVLAIALVVLMVVPAALVGCGSNKANNAAISEALAAAEAARKEAEEAKAAADAAAAEAAAKAAAEAQKALEEANKKAEEAIKAAEEAKKKAEEAEKQAAEAAKTTAAPTTTAPVVTEDMKVVSDYAHKVLSDKDLDFLKTYLTYAYGKTEEQLKDAEESDVKGWLLIDPVMNPSLANPVYASTDIKSMVALYDAAVVAIYQANTVDYINALVANFVATIVGTPTYVERVVDAYEAIDFASKYDVIDVVYANALLAKALDDLDDGSEAEDEFKAKLEKYGEDEIDVMEAIATEFYRYTGTNPLNLAATSELEEDDILYAEMYEEAADVAEAVYDLLGVTAGEELNVADLVYDADIDDDVEAAIKKYTKWNNDNFVKADDKELINHYDAFRQAFVGEAYILIGATDYVWDTLVALEARAAELLDAAAEYKDSFKSALQKIAAITNIQYWKQAENAATVKAALEAWKTKYNFKDAEDGTPDANVLAIIGETVYNNYNANALAIAYFVYLEKTASSVNVDDFVKAYNSDFVDDDVLFDYAKYGSAVASTLDWYYGKISKDINGDGVLDRNDRANGFIHIAPSKVKGFDALLDATYTVSTLIANDNANIAKIFDNLFDLDIADDDKTAFVDMLDAYEALLAKKKAADLINKKIDEALEKGVDIEALDDVKVFVGNDPEAVLNPEDDDDKYLAVAGSIGAWAAGVITKGDANFESMIDWENVETLYANYKASTVDIEKAAVKIALEYIAWQGAYNAEDGEITFLTKVFEDLDPLQIDIYSYDIIKEIVDTYNAIQDIDKGDTKVYVPVDGDDETLEITLETVSDYAYEMISYFYDIVDTLNIDVYATIYKGFPFFSASAYNDLAPDIGRINDWYSTEYTVDQIFAMIDAGDRVTDSVVEKGIKAVLATKKYRVGSNLQFGNPTNTGVVTLGGADVKTVSYQYAIYSVDPYKFANKNDDGVVIGFDQAGYKGAIDTAIANTHKQYLTSYAKTTGNATKYTTIIDIIAKNTLNTGIWNFADEIVINGDVYEYAVNTTGTAWQFVLTDASDDVVGKAVAGGKVDVAVKYDGANYTVRLTPVLVDGVFVITPTLVETTTEITVYDLLDDITAKDFEEIGEVLHYDVRDYAKEIGANFNKVTAISLLGNKSKNLDTFTDAQLTQIFKAEATNDFWVEFNTIKARMWGGSTKQYAWVFGNYITNISVVSADVMDKLNAASKTAYDRAYAMTPDAYTIEDAVKVLKSFMNDVKNILSENNYTVTPTADKYERITVTAPPQA